MATPNGDITTRLESGGPQGVVDDVSRFARDGPEPARLAGWLGLSAVETPVAGDLAADLDQALRGSPGTEVRVP